MAALLPSSASSEGAMRQFVASALDDAAIRDLIAAARDSGINYFDHANIYGGERHFCERRFGGAISRRSTSSR
jgi:predicted oxidoreductase